MVAGVWEALEAGVRAEEEVDQGRISGLVIVDWGSEEMEVLCECEWGWRCCWNEGS